jgi:undecaprenyl-diphosphatase
MPGMQELNVALFHWLAAGNTPHPQILWIASLLATGTVWLCVALIAWAAWRQPSQWKYLVATLVAALAASMLAHAAASAINMPRPFIAGLSPPYIEHGARGSLPSTHATVMFTVALILCMRPALRIVGLAILLIGFVTGWARIYVGVHFPLDILGGFVLAMAIAAVFWALVKLSHRFIDPSHSSTIRPASPD